MNRSLIICDKVSAFPRDTVPLALRIQRAVRPDTDLGELQIFSLDGIYSYVEAEGRGLFPQASRTGSNVAYIALGYWEAVSGKVSPQVASEGLLWLCNSLCRKGWDLRIVLPVIRCRDLAKSSKVLFAKLHKVIRAVCEREEIEPLLAPLTASDRVSVNGPSIELFSHEIGHDMALRVVKRAVQDLDVVQKPQSKAKESKRLIVEELPKPKPKTTNLKKPKKGLIIITEEAPKRRRRVQKREAI